MTFIYIAKFQYGKASLMRAVLVKETAKTVSIEPGSEAIIVGEWSYVPNRLDTSVHKIYLNVDDALVYLQKCAADHVVALKRQTLLAQAELLRLTNLVNSSTEKRG